MDFTELRDKIIEPLKDRPQLAGLANYHLDNIHAGLVGMTNLGHRLEVNFAQELGIIQFPKVMYGPEGQTQEISSGDEEEKLIASGWRTTPGTSV